MAIPTQLLLARLASSGTSLRSESLDAVARACKSDRRYGCPSSGASSDGHGMLMRGMLSVLPPRIVVPREGGMHCWSPHGLEFLDEFLCVQP